MTRPADDLDGRLAAVLVRLAEVTLDGGRHVGHELVREERLVEAPLRPLAPRAPPGSGSGCASGSRSGRAGHGPEEQEVEQDDADDRQDRLDDAAGEVARTHRSVARRVPAPRRVGSAYSSSSLERRATPPDQEQGDRADDDEPADADDQRRRVAAGRRVPPSGAGDARRARLGSRLGRRPARAWPPARVPSAACS